MISAKEAKKQYFLSTEDLKRLPYEKQGWTKLYRRAHLHQASLNKFGEDEYHRKQNKIQRKSKSSNSSLNGNENAGSTFMEHSSLTRAMSASSLMLNNGTDAGSSIASEEDQESIMNLTVTQEEKDENQNPIMIRGQSKSIRTFDQLESLRTLRKDIRKHFMHVLTWEYREFR